MIDMKLILLTKDELKEGIQLIIAIIIGTFIGVGYILLIIK